MNIIVCMKMTFDTEEKIVVESGRVVEDEAKFVINPYDEYALEEAIRLKEKLGGEVTAVTLGPDRVEGALRTALAMGVDYAVHISDEGISGDEYTVACALAAFLRGRPYDLILAGQASVDNGSAQMGARIAELLDLAQICSVTSLELAGRTVRAERDAEGDCVLVEAELPLVVTAQQGLNEPRYPSLPGIMKAKRKPIERLTVGELSLSEEEKLPKTATAGIRLAGARKAGVRLDGEPAEQAARLVELLMNEAKVVQ